MNDKKCSKCSEVKSLDEFYDAPTKDGKSYQCKACQLTYSKEYAAQNKERLREYRRKYNHGFRSKKKVDPKKSEEYEIYNMRSDVGITYDEAKRTDGYWSWTNMIQRCYYEKDRKYKYYGGRGIRVCDRWLGTKNAKGLDGFMRFMEDMGPRPPKHSIDRIDPDGHYCPENCRWLNTYINNGLTRRSKNQYIPPVDD